LITDNKHSDGATATLKGISETAPELRLVKDRKGLFDISSLSHRDDIAILKVQNAVLLENRPQHSLYNDRR